MIVTHQSYSTHMPITSSATAMLRHSHHRCHGATVAIATTSPAVYALPEGRRSADMVGAGDGAVAAIMVSELHTLYHK